MNPDGNTTNPQPDYPHAGYNPDAAGYVSPTSQPPEAIRTPYGTRTYSGAVASPYSPQLTEWINYFLNPDVENEDFDMQLKTSSRWLSPEWIQGFRHLATHRGVWRKAASDRRVNPVLLRALVRSNFEPFKLPASASSNRKQVAESAATISLHHPEIAREYAMELQQAEHKAKDKTKIVVLVGAILFVVYVLYVAISESLGGGA